MRIYYPLNPEDAPTAAELAEYEAEMRAHRVMMQREHDADGWTVIPTPTTEPF